MKTCLSCKMLSRRPAPWSIHCCRGLSFMHLHSFCLWARPAHSSGSDVSVVRKFRLLLTVLYLLLGSSAHAHSSAVRSVITAQVLSAGSLEDATRYILECLCKWERLKDAAEVEVITNHQMATNEQLNPSFYSARILRALIMQQANGVPGALYLGGRRTF